MNCHADRDLHPSGTLVPILDGFDELCSYGDTFNPGDTYEALRALAEASETARIVVTARDGYWNSTLNGISSDSDHATALLRQFAPLDVQEFLEKRLPGPGKALGRSDALRVLDRLSTGPKSKGSDANAVLGRLPLIVAMVADTVENSNGCSSRSGWELRSDVDRLHRVG